LLLLASGCDYSGDWLFAGATDVPGVIHLGEIAPVTAEDAETFNDSVVYTEVGASGSTVTGGVTFSFVGTGSDVCVWVDPELVFWNASVSQLSPTETWAWPDNNFDDGDLEVKAGLALYYTGTPANADEGGQMGNFEVRYQDALGNQVPVDFDQCVNPSRNNPSGGHSGRGTPEYCELADTQPGVTYMVALETFSTPLDDDRLAFGLAVYDGTCRSLKATASSQSTPDECILFGEALNPATGEAWEDSTDFEGAFCANTLIESDDETPLADFCAAEAEEKDCAVHHCFCGDPDDLPTAD
jgi:hypothetical protein